MGKILLTCVLALAFGFGGATAAGFAFHDSFQGPQGPTGLPGAAGPAGADGQDGAEGARGPAGPRGKPGQDATSVSLPTDLGDGNCAGKSVSVITSATIDSNQRLQLTKKQLCIVTPPKGSSTETTSSGSSDSSGSSGTADTAATR